MDIDQGTQASILAILLGIEVNLMLFETLVKAVLATLLRLEIVLRVHLSHLHLQEGQVITHLHWLLVDFWQGLLGRHDARAIVGNGV